MPPAWGGAHNCACKQTMGFQTWGGTHGCYVRGCEGMCGAVGVVVGVIVGFMSSRKASVALGGFFHCCVQRNESVKCHDVQNVSKLKHLQASPSWFTGRGEGGEGTRPFSNQSKVLRESVPLRVIIRVALSSLLPVSRLLLYSRRSWHV
jgi:hypothetical protein